MTDAPPRPGRRSRRRVVVTFLTAVLFGAVVCGGGGLWALFRVLPDPDADRSHAIRVANAYLAAWQRQDPAAATALLFDPTVKDPTEFAALLRSIGITAYRVTAATLEEAEECDGPNCPQARATVVAEVTAAGGVRGVVIPMLKKRDEWFRKDGELWHVAGGERYLCAPPESTPPPPPRETPTC